MNLGGLDPGGPGIVDPSPGIDGLTDVRPIGRDGEGQRYVATHVGMGLPVGVLVLDLPTDPTVRAELLAQAGAIGPISTHPDVVTVFEAGLIGDDRLYLITESLPDPTLAAWLVEKGPLPWPQACDLVLQAGAAMGQVHRVGKRADIRPETVLVVGARAKLGVLGLLGGHEAGRSVETMVHRAPEALDGGGDGRSDIYSLTSVLFQLIDGRAPHWRPGDSVEALRSRIADQRPAELDPELVPPALRVFVAAGLSPDPLDRPQDTVEFVRELELIRHGRTTGPTMSLLHTTTAGAPVIAPEPSWGLDAGSGRPLTGPDDGLDGVGPSTHGPALQWSDPASPPSAANDPTAALPTTELITPGDRRPPSRRPHGGASLTRSPVLLATMGLAAVAILALVGAMALGLFSSDDDQTASGPLLPGEVATGSTPAADQPGSESSPGDSPAPLAMLETTTTTEREPEQFTTTETTVLRATVPNLVGRDVTTAGQILDDAGFGVLVVGRVAPGSTPGTVIEQTPRAGSAVTLPITITLFIPRAASLPQMVGRPADTVCLELQALGLICETRQQFSDSVPAGFVISTSPTGGSGFDEGDTVTLQASRGPADEVAVPDLAGSTAEVARTTLTEAGFVDITEVDESSDAVAAGIVIGSEPAAGTTLAQDQTVTVRVSSGPPARVPVPQLVGLDQQAAEAALTGVGLTATVLTEERAADDPQIGLVVAADQEMGTEVLVGSAVTITVAVGPTAAD